MDEIYLLVLFDPSARQYPNESEISTIFEKSGSVARIISHEIFKSYFFVAFTTKTDMMQCMKSRQQYYDLHGYIIDYPNSPNLFAAEKTVVKDSDELSILDLNDDCLLHLLKFLSRQDGIEFVCRRLLTLCKSHWKRKPQLEITQQLLCLDQIYLFRDSLTRLKLTDFCEPAMLTLATGFIFSRCKGIKYLRISECILDRSSLLDLNLINESLKELVLHFCNGDWLKVKLPSFLRNVIKFRVSEGFRLFESQSLRSFVSQNSFLTTIILPDEELDVGEILSELQLLNTLACKIGDVFTPSSNKHDLYEFFATIAFLPKRLSHLFSVRRRCPKLRHLRIEKQTFLEGKESKMEQEIENLEALLPLDGFYLSDRTQDISKYARIFGESLKILFLEPYYEDIDFHVALPRFPKLEVISWDSDINGDFGKYLRMRSTDLPLTVISRDNLNRNHQKIMPSLKWVGNPEDIFGQFSIYSVAFNWMK